MELVSCFKCVCNGQNCANSRSIERPGRRIKERSWCSKTGNTEVSGRIVRKAPGSRCSGRCESEFKPSTQGYRPTQGRSRDYKNARDQFCDAQACSYLHDLLFLYRLGFPKRV